MVDSYPQFTHKHLDLSDRVIHRKRRLHRALTRRNRAVTGRNRAITLGGLHLTPESVTNSRASSTYAEVTYTRVPDQLVDRLLVDGFGLKVEGKGPFVVGKMTFSRSGRQYRVDFGKSSPLEWYLVQIPNDLDPNQIPHTFTVSLKSNE